MHETVLLREAVDALVIRPEGIYIDGTFGRGGHSREVLSRLNEKGRLLGIDKDPQAVAAGQLLAQQDGRFAMAQGSFTEAKTLAQARGLTRVDGILLDLGVSSPQLDQAERGFSFLRDGPLDMRMNPAAGESAAEWVASASEAEIGRVLKEYGEERFARRIARAIVAERAQAPINTTLRLAKVIADAHPAWEKGRHPATKAFQAIRIHINDELADLETFLREVLELLAVGGRLVIISFHSLEDRIVKRFIRRQERGDELPAQVPVTADQLNRRLIAIGKAVKAGEDEVANNVRSRSAIMRVAEKIA